MVYYRDVQYLHIMQEPHITYAGNPCICTPAGNYKGGAKIKDGGILISKGAWAYASPLAPGAA